jgi:ABC-type Zn2+ transport system substrate-binding protein/surface adhesin
MSLKFKPRDPKPVEDLRKKIQSAEISNFKKELDETFKTIGKEFKKIRENPFLKFFNSLTKEQQQKLLNKFKDELGN